MMHKFPNGPRRNCMQGTYCDVAMKSLYRALNFKKEIENNNYQLSDGGFYLEDSIIQEAITCIVFSVMALEAFFNDYAASSLGDSEFYDNFDHLSIISKFVFNATFILQKEIDKSQSYYFRLKHIVKERDRFVHSKSLEIKHEECLHSEAEAEEYLGKTVVEEPLLDKNNIEEAICESIFALKAIRDIAYFFSDENNIVLLSFGLDGVIYSSETDLEYKRVVLPLIGIKVKEYEV